MSARVLNPAMMSEMGHRGVIGGGAGGAGATRVSPSRTALDRVRRDLFGPVDHAAARALAERELRAQSMMDAERWGFDFRLGKPRANMRYDWAPITSRDVVPEPYALRGMPYLRKHAPGAPRKADNAAAGESAVAVKSWTRKQQRVIVAAAAPVSPVSGSGNVAAVTVARKAERTPPQEPRVPIIGDSDDNTITTSAAADAVTGVSGSDEESGEETCGRKKCVEVPTTPVLPVAARKSQSSITDFMKSRKRSLNSSTKSIVEIPEKIARNAGQIRS